MERKEKKTKEDEIQNGRVIGRERNTETDGNN
jgi:hypothetical protein